MHLPQSTLGLRLRLLRGKKKCSLHCLVISELQIQASSELLWLINFCLRFATYQLSQIEIWSILLLFSLLSDWEPELWRILILAIRDPWFKIFAGG
uniref:Uncharacterized protein n=1 Tax=Rhizophora mucronata TaxID=61149 RepID=A0A2P2IHM3_RHIMU